MTDEEHLAEGHDKLSPVLDACRKLLLDAGVNFVLTVETADGNTGGQDSNLDIKEAEMLSRRAFAAVKYGQQVRQH